MNKEGGVRERRNGGGGGWEGVCEGRSEGMREKEEVGRYGGREGVRQIERGGGMKGMKEEEEVASYGGREGEMECGRSTR